MPCAPRCGREDTTITALALLLWLIFLHRPTGIAPRRKPAAQMRDRLQTHILSRLCGKRRAHAAGAVEDEFFVLLKDRLCVGARRIDPEFQHATGAGERTGDAAVPLDLAGIANIDDHGVVALRRLDRVGRAHRFDLRVGLIDQGFDPAMNGLGHQAYLVFSSLRRSPPADPEFTRPFRTIAATTAPVPSSRLRGLRL